jgi:hypothetical protein
VLDNVEDAKMVTPYLPTTGNGSILFTARNTSPSFTTAQRTLSVKPMTAEECASIMLGIFASDERWATITAEDEEAARDVCAELGGFPLAVSHIARSLLTGGGDFSEVLDLFKTHEAGVLFDYQSEPVDSYYEHNLSTVWNVTFSKFDEASLTFLGIVAFMDPDSISEELFQCPQELALSNQHLSALRGAGR